MSHLPISPVEIRPNGGIDAEPEHPALIPGAFFLVGLFGQPTPIPTERLPLRLVGRSRVQGNQDHADHDEDLRDKRIVKPMQVDVQAVEYQHHGSLDDDPADHAELGGGIVRAFPEQP